LDREALALMTDRAREFWHPLGDEWAGETVFLLGGGPSIAAVDLDRLRGRRAIAINALGHRAPWADVLLFHDAQWFWRSKALVDGWPGTVATVSRAAKLAAPDRVRRLEIEPGAPLEPGRAPMRQGRSAGHTAVSLAACLGASRIILLGYDMRTVDGRTHGHDDYAERDHDIYAREFIPAFRGWNAAAKAAGVEILNATPGSALSEFPTVDLDGVL